MNKCRKHMNDLLYVAFYFIGPLALICMKWKLNFFVRSHSPDAPLDPHWNWIAQTCFSTTVPHCTKRGPERHGSPRLMCKNSSGLSPNLKPTEQFGMNWKAACVPGLLAQCQCLTSLMFLWLNEQIPTAVFTLMEMGIWGCDVRHPHALGNIM